ncbi:MAG: adenylate/guanylate cyclase domain-containing protein [Cocleimonas sp.]
MKLSGNLSIRSKLVIMLLLASVISILVVAYQGYSAAKDALQQSTTNQLTTLREAKIQQVEAYFSDIQSQVQAFSQNHIVIDALNEFRTAYRLAGKEQLDEKQKNQLLEYYRKEFIPRLKEKIGGEPVAKNFLPDTAAANYLQYHYISNNPNKVGEKNKLIKSKTDSSYYSQIHQRYHENLLSLTKQFGYYDLFLIDPETGEIVYSAYKETDFAGDLLNGANATSNLARLSKHIIRNKERGVVEIQDYESYIPSYGAPSAFVAIAVYDGKTIAGILALQIPSHALNDVMTSNKKWKDSGMGNSGEVLLVGRDHLMRSESRFLLQDKKAFLGQLQNIGMPKNEVERISKNNTTILFQPVNAETLDQALSGKKGIHKEVDYRGVEVMSSYAPLRVSGMDWAILSKMDTAEINKPIDKFRRQVMVSASILGIVVTLLALLVSNIFLKPIQSLLKGHKRLAQGESNIELKVTSGDELGELTQSFNVMANSFRDQKQLISDKDAENEMLLLNILPPSIAERMKNGEDNIADLVPNVSIIYIIIKGMVSSSGDETPQESIRRLNHLVQEFDEAAQRHGVDKLKTIGDDYMAVCGLMMPHLDHYKRTLDFALELTEIVKRLRNEFDLDLVLKIAIHSGSVLAGVVGNNKFFYDVWGPTVDIVNEISDKSSFGEIKVSGTTYEQLRNKYNFKETGSISFDGSQTIKIWELVVTNDV